jgi:hypothetical protein
MAVNGVLPAQVELDYDFFEVLAKVNSHAGR